MLKEAGEDGLAINDIVTTISERGFKSWDDPKQAKNSGQGGEGCRGFRRAACTGRALVDDAVI